MYIYKIEFRRDDYLVKLYQIKKKINPMLTSPFSRVQIKYLTINIDQATLSHKFFETLNQGTSFILLNGSLKINTRSY